MRKELVGMILGLPSCLAAMPQGEKVVAGEAQFVSEQGLTTIYASDRCIIEYAAFDVAAGGALRFVQPSEQSRCLNRVLGSLPSHIDGSIFANGQIYLVNPNGIYLGPDSMISAAHFLCAAGHISNQDFLQGVDYFSQLAAPVVLKGHVVADKVVLAGSTIETSGHIVSEKGVVALLSGSDCLLAESDSHLFARYEQNSEKPAIGAFASQDIYAQAIFHKGRIEASNVSVSAQQGSLLIEGCIDAKSTQGGRVHLTAPIVELQGAEIDASGLLGGGGEILIGGGLQGSGPLEHAKQVLVDGSSRLLCNAGDQGDGGLVVLWSDEATYFHGNIEAKGGALQGNGGLIETSSKGGLLVQGGMIDTSSCNGQVGQWLLDPTNITISNAGNVLPTSCTLPAGDYTVSLANVTGAASNVTLCAQNNITSSGISSIAMNSGRSLTLQAGNNILLSGVSITTTNATLTVSANDPGTGIAASGSGTFALGAVTAGNGLTLSTNNSPGTSTITGAVSTPTLLINGNGNINLNSAASAYNLGGITMASAPTLTFGGSSTTFSITSGGGTINHTNGTVVCNGAALTSNLTFVSSASASTITLNNTINALTTPATLSFQSTTPTNISISDFALLGSSDSGALSSISFTGNYSVGIANNWNTQGSGGITLTASSSFIASPRTFSTNSHTNTAGANMSISNFSFDGHALTVNPGTTGVVTFNTSPANSSNLITTGSVTFAAGCNISAGFTLNSGVDTNLIFNGASTITNFSKTGLGAVNLSHSNSLICAASFASSAPVTFTATNASLSNVTFSGTLNSTSSITFTGTSASKTFTGIVGGITPPTNLVFNNTGNISIGNNIFVSGANPLVFNAPITFTGNSVITTNNANLTFSSTLNGPRNIALTAGSGTISFNGAVGGSNPLISLVFLSSGGINIGGNIVTTGANPLNFAQAVTLTGSSIISFSGSGNNITFSSTLNGGQALTLLAGSGNVTFTGAVGGSASLSSLTASATSITFSSTLNGATPIGLTGGASGTITFSAAVGATTPITSLSASAGNITQSAGLTATGAVSYSATTAMNVNGNITTTGSGSITLSGPAAITSDRVLTTNNQLISLSGSLNGSASMTLTSGTAGVSLQGGIGQVTPLTQLLFTGTSGTIQLGASIRTSGALSFPNAVGLIGTTTLESINSSIAFSATINGTQSLTLAAGSGTITFSGAVGVPTPLTNLVFTSSGGINIGANISTTGANSLNFAQAVALTGPCTISNANNSITFSSTLNGNQALTLAAGSGSVTFTGAVGGSAALSSLSAAGGSITQSAGLTATGAVSYSATTAMNVNGNITTTGSGTITLSGPAAITSNRVLTTTNQLISLSGSLDGSASMTLTSGTAGVSLQGGIGQVTPLTQLLFTGTSGTIQLGAPIRTSGALSFPNAVSLIGTTTLESINNPITFSSTLNGGQALTLAAGSGTITFSGAVGGSTPLSNLVFTSSGGINIAANITASGANPLNFAQAVTVPGNPAILVSISNTNNDITFGSTFVKLRNISINAGSGNVTFSGGVASPASPFGSLTVSAGNITFSSVINGPGIINLTAGVNGTITFSQSVGNPNLISSLTATAGNITQSASLFAIGSVSYSTSNSTSLGGNITSGSGTITLNGPVTITSNCTLTTNNQDISLPNAVNSFNEQQSLSFAAGGGTVILGGAVGQNSPLSGLEFISSGGIQVGGNIAIKGNPLNFAQGVTLTNSSAILTNHQNLTFSSLLDGPHALTIATGLGNITFEQEVGDVAPLASISVTAHSITQDAGVKTSGNVIYAGDDPVNAIDLGGNITTTSSGSISLLGPINLNNNAVLTTSDNKNITLTSTLNGPYSLEFAAGGGTVILGGAVGQNSPLSNLEFTSSGGINIGANISTTGANPLDFAQAVTLTGTSIITNANNNVTFASTLNGGQALTLLAGSGNVTFTGAVGGLASLSSLTASATSITQSAGLTATGAVSYSATTAMNVNGNITTTGSGTITLNGPVTITSNCILTTNNQAISLLNIVNSFNQQQSLTFAAGSGIVTLGGPAGQNGALSNLVFTSSGGIHIAGNIFVDGSNSLNFAQAVTLYANSSISNPNQEIVFAESVSGPYRLTASSPATVEFLGAIGSGANPITDLAVTSNTGIYLHSLVHVQSSNNTGITFDGPVVLYNNVDMQSNANASAGGPIAFTHPLNSAGGQNYTLSLAHGAGEATLFDVGNTQKLGQLSISGSGPVQLQGDISTQAGAVSIQSPIVLRKNVVVIDSSGGNVTLSDTIDSFNQLQGLQINGANLVTFSKAIGASSPVSSLTTSNSGSIELGANITAAGSSVTFGDPVLLTADVVIEDTGPTGITFSSTVDGNHQLTLLYHAGEISFGADVGSSIPLAGLATSGSGLVAIKNIQVQSAGVQFSSPVESPTATTLSTLNGGSVTFSSTLYCENSFTIAATGAVLLNADVQTNGNDLLITSSGDTDCNALINTASSSGNSGNVSIESLGSIRVKDISTSSSDFAAGNISLQPNPALNVLPSYNNPVGVLQIGGNLDATGMTQDGDISLSLLGRTALPGLATIASSASGNNIFISCANFTAGDNEIISVIGDFTVNASSSALLGECNTIGNLVLNAPSITIFQHQGGNVLTFFGGVAPITGTRLSSSGNMTASVVPSVTGSGLPPVLQPLSSSIISPNLDIFESLLLPVFTKQDILFQQRVLTCSIVGQSSFINQTEPLLAGYAWYDNYASEILPRFFRELVSWPEIFVLPLQEDDLIQEEDH